MMSVPEELKIAVRRFTYYYTNGTLPLVSGVEALNARGDYRERLLDEPTVVTTAFSILLNHLQLSQSGSLVGFERGVQRAAQFLAEWLGEGDFIVQPPFEDWELEE